MCNQLRETDPSAMSDLFFNLSVKADLCCGEAATLNAKEIGLFLYDAVQTLCKVCKEIHILMYTIS